MPTFSGAGNRRIANLPDCSTSFANTELLVLRPSRWLTVWWLVLHALIAAALSLSFPRAVTLVLPVVLLHAWFRRPRRCDVLIVTDGDCFSLPLDSRFGLRLSPASTGGPGWISLIFPDRPRSQLLVLRDQIDAAGWRRLLLALGKSD